MTSLGPVLVVHNAPLGDAGYAESDAGVLDQVELVLGAIGDLGMPGRAVAVGSLGELRALLAAAPEKLVFNLVEALPGGAEEANLVPALCAIAGKHCTGNPGPCLSLALHKGRAKAALLTAGVDVPPGVLVRPGESVPRLPWEGPCIAKPVQADASEGIHAESAVHPGTGSGLSHAVDALHAQFGQPVLVERLLEGRELNVALLEEDGLPRVLSVGEIAFVDFPPGLPRIVDYAAKWHPGSFTYEHTRRVVPAPLDPALALELERLSLRAWRAMGCRGYARVDLRTDAEGRPWVLEVNPNPDISPDAGFVAALTAAGHHPSHLVRCALLAALRQDPALERVVSLRPSEQDDRDAILALVEATGFFPPHELEVAREVLDDALAGVDGGHYRSVTAMLGGVPVGWACLGPTPCTVGTWDLYWLAVHPAAQGLGVGRRLVSRAVGLARAAGGRLLLAETAGRQAYAPTRAFYLASGFSEEARVRDFYARGDDKVIYLRRLNRV
jgi:D-alanine-D-alanine ligase